MAPQRDPAVEHRPHISEVPSEQTPLLSGGHIAPDGDTEATGLISNGNGKPQAASPAAANEDLDKPLPKLQIFLLCYARMVEPVAFFSIFPFIAQMVQQNGNLPKTDVGFYSGLIESLFSLTQMTVLVFWGRLSDRIGRKPVLLWSLFGMSISPVAFCMAKTIWQMILFRCIGGLFSGSSLIIRTMISEHSTATTQARAFSWFAFAGNVGIFIGPLVGGALADPVNQYPKVFGGNDFFAEYPFALSGFATGAISLTGFLTSIFFLQETLDKDDAESEGAAQADGPERMSIWQLCKSPGVGIVLWVYNHVMLLAFAFTALVPIVLYTPVDIGGLGFSPLGISLYMASQGASQALWLLIVFPWLQYRVGTKGSMKICAAVYPFFFTGYVILNFLLRDGSHGAMVAFWILGFIVAIIGPGVSMVFTGVQLALNDVSPNPHVLGTLNALALTFSSGIRSIAPGVSTAIYAVGVREHILWGHLMWLILIFFAALLPFAVRMLPESEIPAELKKKQQQQQEDADEGLVREL